MPPTTTMVNTARFWIGEYDAGSKGCWWWTNSPPARAAMAPERAKAARCMRDGVDAVGLGRPLVVAQGHQRPAEAADPHAPHAGDDEHQDGQRPGSRRRLGVDTDRPPSSGPARCARWGTQSKNSSFSRYEVVASEKAKVVTARYRPRSRAAGCPPTRPPPPRRRWRPPAPANRSASHSVPRHPATAAPMAKNATWPSETVPPQPDSSTSDRPSTA